MNVAVHSRSAGRQLASDHAAACDTISLCAGGGGLDLALELAIPGARSVCMVEREAFAVAHLVAAMRAGRLAPCPVWSDARTFDGRPWRGLVDGVIGGIPCQPHSLAGRKRGSLDARDLWSTARRIIVEARAWFVLIENVGGMLAAGADEIAGAERVWRDLRKLGFAVEGGLFTAAEVGARHQRERLFILGIHDGPGGVGRGLADGDGERLEGLGPDAATERREDAGRPAGLCDRANLEHTARIGRGKGRAEPELRRGRAAAGGASEPVGNAIGGGHNGRRDEPFGRALGGTADEGAGRGADDAMADADREHDHRRGARGTRRRVEPADGGERVADAERVDSERRRNAGDVERAGSAAEREARERQRSGEAAHDHVAGNHLFPPGPGDIAAWRAIVDSAPQRIPAISRRDRFLLAVGKARAAADGDPAQRERLDPHGPYGLRAAIVQEIAQSLDGGVADGLALGLDPVAVGRVDRLRMLGNGVVPLEGAYAIRTLVARLADRGSARAAQLLGGVR